MLMYVSLLCALKGWWHLHMHVFSCIHLPNNYLNIRVCVCLFVCLCVGYFRGLTGSSCLVTQLRVHTAFMEVSVCVLCAVWWSIWDYHNHLTVTLGLPQRCSLAKQCEDPLWLWRPQKRHFSLHRKTFLIIFQLNFLYMKMHPTVYYSARNKCKGKHRRVIFKPSLSISVKCKNAIVKSSCCQRCAVYELMYKVIY